MVELTIEVVLDIIRTSGIIVGIFYYVTTLRNADKNRMKEMVFRRMQTRSPDYFMDVYNSSPMSFEWDSVEEFHRKYNPQTTPELYAKRASIQDKLTAWGYLLREGVVDIEFIGRMHNPSFIQNWWESNEPIYLESRKIQNNPDLWSDFEFLYKAVMKKYPNSQSEPRFKNQRN